MKDGTLCLSTGQIDTTTVTVVQWCIDKRYNLSLCHNEENNQDLQRIFIDKK